MRKKEITLQLQEVVECMNDNINLIGVDSRTAKVALIEDLSQLKYFIKELKAHV